MAAWLRYRRIDKSQSTIWRRTRFLPAGYWNRIFRIVEHHSGVRVFLGAPPGLFFPFEILRMNFALSWINEWQSPDFQSLAPIEPWILLVLLAALFRGLRLPITRIIMVLGLLHEALQHQRQDEILGLVSPLLAAPALAVQLPKTGALFERFAIRIGGAKPVAAAAFSFALLLAVAATIRNSQFAARADRFTPAAALGAAENANLRGKVFNSYDFGGFLIFSGIAPFIDGRADMYGDDFVRSYADVAQLPRLLAQYRISWALLTPKDPHIALLDHLAGWRKVYSDKIAVVYAHQSNEASN